MPPGDARKSQARRRLIEAAYEEFSAKGIMGSTTRSIAERAGCNEVTLFRHFGSKEALLEASVEHAAAELLDICRLQDAGGGTLHEDLRRFAAIYDEVVTRTEGIVRALIGESGLIPCGVNSVLGTILERFHGAMVRHLQSRGTEDGISTNLDLGLLAQSFTATLTMAVLRRTSGLLQVNRDAWLDHVAALYAAALQGNGGLPNP